MMMATDNLKMMTYKYHRILDKIEFMGGFMYLSEEEKEEYKKYRELGVHLIAKED